MARTITINSRKYDGRISKSWQAEAIEEGTELLLFKGEFEFPVDHPKLGFVRRGTMSYEYYWLDKWYNVFRFHEPDGKLRNFYCNVATPAVLSNEMLEYTDLDIDILADPELNYEILDLDEFEARTVEMSYPSDFVIKARSGLAELIYLIEHRQFPFNAEV